MTAPGPATILLVDDERDILSTLKAGIERGLPGVRVLTAPDARGGLDLLSTEGIDVVISDQRMPGMQGVDFLVECRRLRASTHRMMMTAFPDERLLERDVNEAHIAHFFKKPYRIGDVVSVLRAVLDERRRRDAEALALARAISQARPGGGSPLSFKTIGTPFRGALE